jgi:Flp pilus assembly protein TadD
VKPILSPGLRRAGGGLLLSVTLILPGCRKGAKSTGAASDTTPKPPAARGATFVGREKCAPCHAEELRRWTGSHHDLAMQEPTPDTVLGDFENARFTHYGVVSTFTRKDEKYFVRTDGPEGKLTEYPIAYTFGVYPLQQYLIAFPGGRYQALNVVWDARPAKEGGHRWFHLYPKEEVSFRDPLHWTGPYQNWNFMCAECHSTNVKKGWSPETRSYATTFSEIDVSCEACHGPGSAHVAWGEAVRAGKAKAADADKGLAVDLRDPAHAAVWEMDMKTGIAKRSSPRTSHTEIETCARCHARRSVVAAEYEYGKPLLETHRPAILEDPLYRADGQIQDEVYEYGSFLQSKMHAAGVTCSDCHDPHDLKVKGGADRVCAGCHLAEKFDSPKHHFHAAGSKGASCVACHMPTRDYMVVHGRRDHSMRIPRPDLSVSIGTPNACTGCHRDQSDRWAAEAASKWWGNAIRKERTYGEIVHAGREQSEGAQAELAVYVGDAQKPAIRRATAAALLDPRDAVSRAALERALSDPEPYVRHGALSAVEALEPSERLHVVAPLLRDPIRTIRIEAARTLVSLPGGAMTASERAAFEGALAEYVSSQNVDGDRPEAHVNLGALQVMQGNFAGAEAEYRTAVAIMPAFGGAWVNLADLYRSQGREAEAERALRDGLAASPDDPGLHHALGLSYVRQKRLPEALTELRKSAELAPANVRYAYVYGVALDSSGQTEKALQVLAAAHARHGANPEVLEALASFSARAGKRADAIAYAEKLVALEPNNLSARALLDSLKGAPAQP